MNGLREPNDEELANFEESGVEEVIDESGSFSKELQGVPSFWMEALKNHPTTSEIITKEDVKALESLRDIRVSYFADKPGFKIEFEFGPNEYFTNTLLTKEYHLAEQEGGQEDYVYDHAVGSKIEWKPQKNLCFKTVLQNQVHRSKKTTRTVEREVATSSFFHFFIPPVMPEEEDEEEEDIKELEARIEMDYTIGDALKEDIVPNAVDWFTGKAIEYDEYSGDDEEENTDEIEEGSEELSEQESSFANTRAEGLKEKPECKQQ